MYVYQLQLIGTSNHVLLSELWVVLVDLFVYILHHLKRGYAMVSAGQGGVHIIRTGSILPQKHVMAATVHLK